MQCERVRGCRRSERRTFQLASAPHKPEPGACVAVTAGEKWGAGGVRRPRAKCTSAHTMSEQGVRAAPKQAHQGVLVRVLCSEGKAGRLPACTGTARNRAQRT